MNLTRYEPCYRPLSLLDKLLSQDLYQLRDPQLSRSNDVIKDWLPAVDIQETDEKFVLTADLPGVNPDAIEVTMEDGVLTIQGERETTTKEIDQGYQRFERVTGKFLRKFTLPDTANGESISATTSGGVLAVTIPKQEKVKPRRIAVASA